MSTTTLRIDDALKRRIAKAARRAKKSPHNFMLEALAQVVTHDELREEFERDAEAGLKQVLSTGKVLDWDETVQWALARVAGKKAARPKARKSLLAK